jgi:hypothetical protein
MADVCEFCQNESWLVKLGDGTEEEQRNAKCRKHEREAYETRIRALESELAELRKREAWIPVAERAHFHLNQGTKVLAYHADWGVSEGWVNSMGSVSGNWAGGTLATHWRPMPRSPRPEPGDDGKREA